MVSTVYPDDGMTSNSNPPVPNLTFPTSPPWQIRVENPHDPSLAYRQMIYHPNRNQRAGANERFTYQIAEGDGAGELDRAHMWPRLLCQARHVLLEENLRWLVDTRDVLLFTRPGSTPSRTGDNIDPRSGSGQLHQRLKETLPLFFQSRMVGIRIPPGHAPDSDDLEHVVPDTSGRLTRLFDAMKTDVKNLVETEYRQQTPREGGVRINFEWLHDFERSLDECIAEQMAARNWADANDAEQIDAIVHATANIPPMTRLVSFLMERDKLMFKSVNYEHIFGCLVDKRLQLLSPFQLTSIYNAFLEPGVGWFVSPCPRGPPQDDMYDIMYRVLGKCRDDIIAYQENLRSLSSYRQLVEWGYRPLWRQLYVTVPACLGIDPETVNEFLSWTTNTYLTRNIFSVLPVHDGQLSGQSCTICMDDLDDDNADVPHGSVIAQLHCGHYFHPQCILTYWDGFARYTNQCPLCRQPAGSLRDMLGPLELAVNDRDYQVNTSDSVLDEALRQQFAHRAAGLNPIIGLGNHIHSAWWKPQIYDYLSRRRHRREQQGFVVGDSWLYGVENWAENDR